MTAGVITAYWVIGAVSRLLLEQKTAEELVGVSDSHHHLRPQEMLNWGLLTSLKCIFKILLCFGAVCCSDDLKSFDSDPHILVMSYNLLVSSRVKNKNMGPARWH